MVRFKNRWLLVQWLLPPTFMPVPSSATTTMTTTNSSIDGEDARERLGRIDERHLANIIRAQLQQSFGLAGLAASSSLSVRYICAETQLSILKVGRESSKRVRAALVLLTSLPLPPPASAVGQPSRSQVSSDEVEVLPRVLHVSGTLKKLQRRALEYDRELALRLAAAIEGHPSAWVDSEEESDQESGSDSDSESDLFVR